MDITKRILYNTYVYGECIIKPNITPTYFHIHLVLARCKFNATGHCVNTEMPCLEQLRTVNTILAAKFCRHRPRPSASSGKFASMYMALPFGSC